MSTILKYVINMLPFFALTVPLYWGLRILFLKWRNARTTWQRELTLFLFVLFTAGLASQAILPKITLSGSGLQFHLSGTHTTNLTPFRVFYDTYVGTFVHGNPHHFLINFLGNIAMFVPIGFCIPLLWSVSFKQTLLFGFCSSLFIEVTQLFLPRSTDVDDLILNTFGILLGALVYQTLQKHLPNAVKKYKALH